MPKLSLGPILYYWSREQVIDFYKSISGAPVDVVYLGETVCSKRRLMRFDDWMDVADMLEKSGKQVVLSTLTLLEANSELASLKKSVTTINTWLKLTIWQRYS